MGRKDSGGEIGTWAARVLARPEAEIEPFLIKQGFLQRTPRGRIATLAAYRHLGVTLPQAAGGGLFDV